MTDEKYALQFNLETLYSKHQLLPILREEFSGIANQYPNIDDHEFIRDMLAQICLHRQANPPTLVGILSPKYGTPQEIADKMLLMCEFDYIDFNENTGNFVVKYDVSTDVQEMLDRYQYPLPMIVPPEKIMDNHTTGYHTIPGSVVLNGSNYFSDRDMCLDHLDRANGVPLVLDFAVIKSVQGKYIKPTRKEGESYDDYRKRMKQASVFYNVSLEVMEGISLLSDVLYLTHKYDRRGRCYASGYHINTQGTDYNKAALQLARKEVLT